MQLRVDIWLDPWKDPSNKGYQIVQSLFALAAGGLFGRGLGEGYLTLQSGDTIIPNLETDFIFSAIGEELGLVGAAGIIILFLIFTYRGFRIAVAARDDFSRLLTTGLTSMFALQSFLIVGGVIKLIPLTGITLPFVSYGGSSIVANFVLLALLLRTSDMVNQGKRAGAEETELPGLRRRPSAARSIPTTKRPWREAGVTRPARREACRRRATRPSWATGAPWRTAAAGRVS